MAGGQAMNPAMMDLYREAIMDQAELAQQERDAPEPPQLNEDEDISPLKDRQVLKRRLADGSGYQKPKDGGRACLVLEEATDGEGKALEGFQSGRELDFAVGDGEVCEALELLVVQMVQEERASVSCPAALCGDLIEAKEGRVTLTATLKSFENGQASWEMSWEEKIAYAAARKEVGTRLFKEKRILLAQERFRSTAEFLRSYVGLPEAGDELLLLCELNRAACLLKLEDFFGAKAACTTVLMKEPENAKALFRRATAYVQLHEFAEAVADLRKLLQKDSENREAQRLLLQAQKGAKEAKEKAKSMFSNMHKAFSGFAEDEARRVREAKEAHEASIAKKSAEAKAEAKKLREQRGERSAEAAKEDLQRAGQAMAEMQRKCWEISMGKPGEED